MEQSTRVVNVHPVWQIITTDESLRGAVVCLSLFVEATPDFGRWSRWTVNTNDGSLIRSRRVSATDRDGNPVSFDIYQRREKAARSKP